MRYLILLLFSMSTLFSSTILTFKVYERQDRVDVLLTFDTPFEERISQAKGDNETVLTLYGAQYDKSVTKQVKSPFIDSFTFVPQSDRTLIRINMPQTAQLAVSKTVDNYGLRLRFNQSANAATLPTRKDPTGLLDEIQESNANTLPTKEVSSISTQYIVVVSMLFLAVIVLYIIKRRIDKKNQSSSWLFKSPLGKSNTSDFKIIFQKPIDAHNRIVMMEVGSKQYLAIVGNSNVLLDTFGGDDVKTQEGFEKVLRDNQQELDRYMKLDNERKDPLQAYKEKASLEAYRNDDY